MIFYLFPILIGILGGFFIVERHRIAQLLPVLKAQALFIVGICYIHLGILGIALLYFVGEDAFLGWVIGILVLTAFLPVIALLIDKPSTKKRS